MQERIGRILDRLTWVEMIIAFLSLATIAGVLAVDVIMREFFGGSLFGSLRVGVYSLILCAMAGFGIATATGSHLRPTFADKLIPARYERVAQRIGQVASSLIMVTLAWASWRMVAFAEQIGERDVALGIPIWWVQTGVPLAFSIAALRYISYAIYPDLLPAEEGTVE